MDAARSSEAAKAQRAGNAWLWVPSLYFSQGIPYVIVMTLSVVMYKRLGVSNTDIALYTSWLYLPWVVKPLWSPIVDITRTKRGWVVTMQFLISCALGIAAAAVPAKSFFVLTLAVFWIMALASATHDIAADGFYMLSMSRHEQAWWVGLRSTFYRTAMIVGSGLLVVLAGVLESKNGVPPAEVKISAVSGTGHEFKRDPPPPLELNESSDLGIRLFTNSVEIAISPQPAGSAGELIQEANRWNNEHGIYATPSKSPARAEGPAGSGGFWHQYVSAPFAHALEKWFPKRAPAQNALDGNVGAIYLSLSRPPPEGRVVTVNCDRKKSGLEYVGLAKGDKGFRVVAGERIEFNATNWNQPAAVIVQLDPKISQAASAVFAFTSGNIPLAWAITLFSVAGIFLGFSIWHALVLPRPAADGPVRTGESLVSEFFETLASFFRKPGVGMALAFILSYRFDEAQLSKVISPFLLDSRTAGGLGLTTSQVGLAYGTFGILALTCGGLLGGFTAARFGLKTMLPVMVCSMYLPKLAFVGLSFLQPENFLLVCVAIAVEQFGYGFGFTAFMLYMLYFADGPRKTAHYAICTGFMALGMMIPGMWSGWLVDIVGYRHFFAWVVCSAVPGLVIALRLKVDPGFGKK
jgi:PAT family beta-lactamase induction signal transducer AmpG